MPVTLTKKKAILSGQCDVDDAETLFRFLAENEKAQVDLSEATHLHAAIYQALAATKRRISKHPEDAFVASCIDQLYKL
jgi:hypothetical protein